MLRLACSTYIVALTAAALCAQSDTPPPVVATTAMVGLAEGQTAQLNLLNPGAVPPATAAICTATVTFYDADGINLKSSVLPVLPGKSLSFDLHDTELGLAVGGRREIRAVIVIPAAVPASATATPTPACKVIPTLEIFDSISGHTLVTLGHVEVVP